MAGFKLGHYQASAILAVLEIIDDDRIYGDLLSRGWDSEEIAIMRSGNCIAHGQSGIVCNYILFLELHVRETLDDDLEKVLYDTLPSLYLVEQIGEIVANEPGGQQWRNCIQIPLVDGLEYFADDGNVLLHLIPHCFWNEYSVLSMGSVASSSSPIRRE